MSRRMDVCVYYLVDSGRGRFRACPLPPCIRLPSLGSVASLQRLLRYCAIYTARMVQIHQPAPIAMHVIINTELLWALLTPQYYINRFSFLMANVVSTLTKKRSLGALVIALIYALYRAKQHFQQQYSSAASASGNSGKKRPDSKRKARQKVGVNAQFFKQMRKLLPICIPGMFAASIKHIHSSCDC